MAYKKTDNVNDVDVAIGWILLKQYADSNNSDGTVAVAKKMQKMETKAGQTVQAFNILGRRHDEICTKCIIRSDNRLFSRKTN